MLVCFGFTMWFPVACIVIVLFVLFLNFVGWFTFKLDCLAIWFSVLGLVACLFGCVGLLGVVLVIAIVDLFILLCCCVEFGCLIGLVVLL